MSSFGQDHNKLVQKKVGRSTKAFVDHNLQIQMPTSFLDTEKDHSLYRPIYSHFSGSTPSGKTLARYYEAELFRAMEEAERSYIAWKQLKERVENKIKKS